MFVDCPKCTGLYVLTETLGFLVGPINLGFETKIGSGVFHLFIIEHEIERLSIKMKERMLTQVA